MALALSGSRLLAALPHLALRRGYAAAAASGAMKRAAAAGDGQAAAAFAGEAKEAVAAAEVAAWVPDPVTGHYRPANWAEVDPAELRAALLSRGARA